MSDQLTPGPWYLDPTWGPSEEFPNWAAIKIGDVSSASGHIGAANARLIAAAPDLLAALKAAQKDLETVQREMSGIAPEAVSPALPLIRAAIAKAEGK